MDLNEFWSGLKEPGLQLVGETWPETKEMGFLDALREIEPAAYERLETTSRIAREFSDVPILAVIGPINGGKSSLVRSFLAPPNRERVPVGLGSRQGTQRFVLWIPRSWESDPALFERLETILGFIFEDRPEHLSADPDESREQYADVSAFHRPLVAFDEGLDRHGVALLDCPDMQRLQENEKEGENLRLEAIAKASEICAGVIIVTPRSQIEIRDLGELVRRRIPEAVRIFAINLIRPPEPPEAVYDELCQALRTKTGILCYGAYDFLVPASRDFTPAWDENFQKPEDAREPCFFRIDSDAGRNGPDRIQEERSIHCLADLVRPAVIRQKRQREIAEDLLGQVREQLAALDAKADAERVRVKRAAGELHELAHELMHDGDQALRLKIDPEIVMSFKESMERTAPLQLKPLIALRRRIVHRAVEAVRQGREAMARAFPWLRAGGKFESLKNRLQKQLIQEKDIEKLLYRWSVATREAGPERSWKEEARAILERYRVEERTNMTREEWDALARQIWKNTSKLKATVRIFGSFFVGLAAVILIPFDGGASVLGITALELMGVLGLGGLMAAGTLRMLDREMNQKIGCRQFSNFIAIAGDRIGIPRPVIEEMLDEKELFKPALEEQLDTTSYGVREAGWRLFAVNPKARKKLLAILKQWEKEHHAVQTT